MEQGQIKVCSKCKQEKSFNDFAIARDKKDGKSSQCRICSRERGRNWREKCRSRPDIKIPATKKCACCKETKPAVEFYENKEKKSGLGSWCKICLAKKWVEHSFKYRYGITLEERDQLIINQNQKCAICEADLQSVRAVVDHSHKTGIVRGILCQCCNAMLGMARDNTNILKSAITYLEKLEIQGE